MGQDRNTLSHNKITMKYLYYKIYQILRKVKTNNTPATNSMILLSLIQGANIIALQALLNQFIHVKIKLGSKDEIILFACSLGLVIYVINYLKLYKKLEEICESYENESKTQSRIGYTVLILYIFVSAVLIYFVSSKYPL